jgi:MFS family permease
MLVMGLLVAKVGYCVMPVAGVLFLAVSIGTALLQPEISTVKAQTVPSDKAEKGSAKDLLRNGRYVLMTAAVFLAGLASAPINNMKALVFSSVGGDVSFIGWDSFIGCMIQLPFLVFAFKLVRVRAERRLILGVIAALGYALMVATASSPAMVIMGTALCNVSFGLKYPAMRELTEKWVRPELRNTAHSVIDTAYGSLAGMISSAWSGVVMEQAGTQVMGLLCAGFAASAVLLSLGLLSGKRAAPRIRRRAECS